MQYHLTLALDITKNLNIFLLLSTCTHELISVLNIITLLSNPLPSDNEKLPRVSNPTLYPEYLYLPKSAVFCVHLTTPKKKVSNVKSTPCYVITSLSFRQYKCSLHFYK